jgi:hypothetical protein
VKRILVGIVAAAVLTGCGSSGGYDSSSSEPAKVNPLDTPKTATCQDWLDATQDERDEAALRFVQALRAFDQSPHFAHTFAVGISKDCDAAPTMRLPEVAGALATLDTEDFPH